MESKTACSNYLIDIMAQEFGACKNCGFKKFAHNTEALSSLRPSNQGSLKDKVTMFSQGNFTPSLAVEQKSIAIEAKSGAETSKPLEEKFIAKNLRQKEEGIAEKLRACNDFKIDVGATEFNSCKNCQQLEKYHGAQGFDNKLTSSSKFVRKSEPERKDKEQKEGESQRKKEPKKQELPEKKLICEEKDENKETDQTCSKFQIDVTGAFNTCKNCHLHRKFHDQNAITSGIISGNSSLADQTQNFKSIEDKRPPILTDASSMKKDRRDFPLTNPSQSKKIEEKETLKEDTKNPSNKPSQSVPVVEGVMSVKERMKMITHKKEFTKENIAAKEIKSSGASGVKELAAVLSALGLLVPKIGEQPMHVNNLEGEKGALGLGNNKIPKEEVQEKNENNIFAEFKQEDIDCLQATTSWLTDNVVMAFIQYYLIKNQMRAYLFPASVFESLMKNDDPDDPVSQNLFSELVMHYCYFEEIVFPVNTSGNTHWTLFRLNLENGRLICFDSFHQKNFPKEISIINKIFMILTRGNAEKVLKIVYPNNFQKQNNSYDCGVFIIQIIKKKYEIEDVNYAEFPHFRYKYLDLILKNLK